MQNFMRFGFFKFYFSILILNPVKIQARSNKFMTDFKTDQENQLLSQKMRRRMWKQSIFLTVSWNLTMKINEEKTLLFVKMVDEANHKNYEKAFEPGSLKSLEEVYHMFELMCCDMRDPKSTRQLFDRNLPFFSFQQKINLSSGILKVAGDGKIQLSCIKRIRKREYSIKENLQLEEIDKDRLISSIVQKVQSLSKQLYDVKKKNKSLENELEKMKKRNKQNEKDLENIVQIEKKIQQLQAGRGGGESKLKFLKSEYSEKLVDILEQIQAKQLQMDTKIFFLSKLPNKMNFFEKKIQEISEKLENLDKNEAKREQSFISLKSEVSMISRKDKLEKPPQTSKKISKKLEKRQRNQSRSQSKRTIVWV